MRGHLAHCVAAMDHHRIAEQLHLLRGAALLREQGEALGKSNQRDGDARVRRLKPAPGYSDIVGIQPNARQDSKKDEARASLHWTFKSRMCNPAIVSHGVANMKLKYWLIVLSNGILAGCAGTTGETLGPTRVAALATPAAYSVDKLIGNWGIASYREEKDRARTEAQARAACKLPYAIAKGPTDGVMMHVADDTAKHELTLKGAPGGKTYLGFEGPAGDEQDREILSLADNMFVTRYISPETHTRYGTFIYIRCGARR